MQSDKEPQRTRDDRADSASEREWLRSMLQISNTVQSTLELDQVLKIIVDGIHRLGYDRARLYLLENDVLVGKVQTGETPAQFDGLKLSLDQDAYSRKTLELKSPIIYRRGELGPDVNDTVLEKQDLDEWAELPLVAQDKSLGKITVDNKFSRRAISDRELELLVLFANQAAIAIENARAFKSQCETEARLKLLLGVNNTVAGAKTVDAGLKILAEEMVSGLATTFCCILLLDDSTRKLKLMAAYPIRRPSSKNLQWGPDVGKSFDSPRMKQLIDLPKPKTFRNDDMLGDHNITQHIQKVMELEERLDSVLVIPMRTSERGLGLCILAESRNWERSPFSADKVELAHSMSAQATVLIERIGLQEQSQRDLALMQRLYEAGSVIGSTLDPDQTLKSIFEKACQAVEGWRAVATLFDDNGQPFHLVGSGFDDPMLAPALPRPEGISLGVFKTGEVCILEDVLEKKELVNPDLVQAGVRAAVCLPLRLGNQNIGVLWIDFKEPRHFMPAQIEALKLFATQIAIAYDNARRIQQLEHLHRAAEALASVANVRDVLTQIAQSARKVLGADSSVIWSYDPVRQVFFQEELVADNIPFDILERFQQEETEPGRTTRNVIERQLVEVTDMETATVDFLGDSTRRLLREIGAVAFQAIMLQVENEPLGLLYVNYNQRQIYTTEERKTLRTFANHAALALKKARLLDQVKRAQEASKIVAQVMRLGDHEETLQSIAYLTMDAVRCDVVVLYGYNPNKGQLEHPPSMAGVRYQERTTASGQVLANSLVYTILKMDQPYIVPSNAEDPLFRDKRFTKDEGIQSCVAIPLQAAGEKVGVMFVNYRNPHRFTDDDLANIELFANQAAVAIKNAQQYEASVEARRQLEALHTAGQTISEAGLEIQTVLQTILDQAVKVTEAHFGSLQLVEGDALNFVAAFPAEKLEWLRRKIGRMPINGKGITARAVRENQALLISDIQTEPDFVDANERSRSELAVVFRQYGKGKPIGVLNVEHPEEGAFDPEDRLTLIALSNLAEVALRNAGQYKELEKTKDSMLATEAVAWLGIFGADWQHTISQKTFSFHNYANALRIWLSRQKSQVPPEVYQVLDGIDTLAQEMHTTQFISRVPAGDPEERRAVTELDVALPPIVNHWCRTRKNVQRIWDLNCPQVNVRIDTQWLHVVMEKLVNNALKAMPQGGRLTIATRRVDDQVQITFKDTGKGIPAESLPYFLKQAVPRPAGSPSSGMGALIARFILLKHGGNLTLVNSKLGQGTELLMTLPVALD